MCRGEQSRTGIPSRLIASLAFAARLMALGLLLQCHLFATSAGAQPAAVDSPTEAQVLEWFEAEWKKWEGVPDLDNLLLVIETRYYGSRSPQAAAAKWAEIQGLDDHPERQMIEEDRRLQREGPYVCEIAVLIDSARRWRYTRGEKLSEGLGSRSPFISAAVDNGVAWSASNGKLTVAPASDWPAAFSGMPPDSGQVMLNARQFFSGSLGFMDWSEIRAKQTTIDGSQWTIVCQCGDRFEMEWRGEWRDGRGFVSTNTNRTFQREAKHPTVIIGGKFADWEYRSDIGLYVASRVDRFSLEGWIDESSHFVSVEEVSDADARAMTRVPEPSVTDSLIGSHVYAELHDYRNGSLVVSSFDSAGEVASTQRVGASGGLGLRTLGWIVGGIMLAAVVAAVLHRYGLLAGGINAIRIQRK